MSRRPKLILGQLYLIKNTDAYDPGTDKRITCTYVGLLEEHGSVASLNKKFALKPSPGFYMDLRVQASSFRGDAPGYVHRIFLDQKDMPLQYVIQKFNPKNLPLYMNWFWNEWILTQLKEQPNGTTAQEPALAGQP